MADCWFFLTLIDILTADPSHVGFEPSLAGAAEAADGVGTVGVHPAHGS